MPLARARQFYNSLISPDAQDGRATGDAIETPSFRNMNSRTMNDKFFDKFLDTSLDGIVANYINAVVKRTEFNRRLGSPFGPDATKTTQQLIKQGLWDPKKGLNDIIKQARKEGATDADLRTLEKYVDANLGQLGRDDISPGMRRFMAGVIAYQNTRVLLFTVFASLPDVTGPAIRSGSMRVSFKVFKDNMWSIVKNEGDVAEVARAYGVISDAMNNHIMTEYVDNHYMPAKLRKWNDGFFKWTGLNWWTDSTRKFALAVGIDYIQNQAELTRMSPVEKTRFKAEAALAELGLTPELVEQWQEAGKPTFNNASHDGTDSMQVKVAEALVQFVDESIMRPNASQRPIMASHPGAMLVYHLKGFMYAMHDVYLKRIVFNIRDADSQAAAISALMAPALTMMLLTAVGLELREMVQYIGSNRKPPTDRMDGWEYSWELFERAGLTGVAQLAFDFEGASDRGMSHVAGISGPALNQITDILSKPHTQTIPKAIPVISQLPGARSGLRTVL